MKNRKIINYSVLLTLCLVLFAGTIFLLLQKKAVSGNKKDPLLFVVINAPHGYVDQGFNQATIDGACAFLKIPKSDCTTKNEVFRRRIRYGYPGTLAQPRKIYDFVKSQERKYPDRKRVFVFPGFTFSNFLIQYLDKFDSKSNTFVSVDTWYSPEKGKPWPGNLYQYSFNQQYAGYNAGLYTAIQAILRPELFKDADKDPTNGKQIRFGSLGGLNIPPIAAYALGFALAIEKVNQNKQAILQKIKESTDPLVQKIVKKIGKINPQQRVDLSFYKNLNIGGFDPTLKSGETYFLSKELFEKGGVSVVFSIAVPLTSVMQKVAKEQNFLEKKRQNWVVGVDIDQGLTLGENPPTRVGFEMNNVFITSAQINLEKLTKITMEKIVANELSKGSAKVGDLKTKENREFVQISARYQNPDNPAWVIYKRLLEKEPFNGAKLTQVTPAEAQKLNTLIGYSGSKDKAKIVFKDVLNDEKMQISQYRIKEEII